MVFEAGDESAAVDEVELRGVVPIVFCVVYFEAAVVRDTGANVSYERMRDREGGKAVLVWLDGTEIAADDVGLGVSVCWEFSALDHGRPGMERTELNSPNSGACSDIENILGLFDGCEVQLIVKGYQPELMLEIWSFLGNIHLIKINLLA